MSLLLAEDEVCGVTLSIFKAIRPVEMAQHLSDIKSGDGDNEKILKNLRIDLQVTRILEKRLERSIMELAIRKGYYQLKSEGNIEKGKWTAVGANATILACEKDHTETVRHAEATGNHFIVRYENFED